jgi:hypothetical protein
VSDKDLERLAERAEVASSRGRLRKESRPDDKGTSE